MNKATKIFEHLTHLAFSASSSSSSESDPNRSTSSSSSAAAAAAETPKKLNEKTSSFCLYRNRCRHIFVPEPLGNCFLPLASKDWIWRHQRARWGYLAESGALAPTLSNVLASDEVGTNLKENTTDRKIHLGSLSNSI